jgi:hypothetical protein
VIGVPAIGGHPENTWVSKAVFTHSEFGSISRSNTVMEMLKNIPVPPAYSVTSPILSSPTKSPRLERTEPAWITRGVRTGNNEARVLLYDHGEPEEGDTLKILAVRLLKNIENLRRLEKETRPLFFICHSTGGLVVKMALAEAQRYKNPILGDCYGVTFFSTPHRGSSYLSRLEFSSSVAEIMKWSAPLPESISEQLSLDHHLLRALDSDFKGLATEFRVWTFFETEDTDLSNEFHAPITSIKSALLNLRHEVVYPLLSDHANCASFGTNNQQTKTSYLSELSDAIEKALELSKTKHTEMNLEDRVEVEINGFYEVANDEASMKVWSTKRSLHDFKRHGPAKLLKDRLSELNAPPKEKQYMRQNTRASNFQPSKSKSKAGAASPAPKAANIPTPPNPASSGLGAKTKKFLTGKSKEKPSEDIKLPQSIQLPTTPPGKDTAVVTISGDGDRSLLSPSIVLNTSGDAPNTAATEDTQEDALQSVAFTSDEASNIHSHGQNTNGELAAKYLDQLRPRTSTLEKSSSAMRRGSDASNIRNFPTAFSRPHVSKQKLVWIHVPFNNPIWVKVNNFIHGRASLTVHRMCFQLYQLTKDATVIAGC